MNPIYAAMGATIFEEMSALARAHGAINLGQGSPMAMAPKMSAAPLPRRCTAAPTSIRR